MDFIAHSTYFIATMLLILGLKGMSSPKTASNGFRWASIGVLLAALITLISLSTLQHWVNFVLLILALGIGSSLAVYSGMKVKMIQMPQMIALFNAMGGGAAAAIAIVDAMNFYAEVPLSNQFMILASIVIGTLSLSGSLIAFAKLQEWLKRPIIISGHLFMTIALAVVCVVIILLLTFDVFPTAILVGLLFVCLTALGVMFTLPIGGANMPIIISLFNSMTGLAVAGNGLFIGMPLLIIAGLIVGASGLLLTYLMAKAMNQSLQNILFAPFKKSADIQGESEDASKLKPISVEDAAVLLAYASSIIIVPGYGMAVAQAQYKIAELMQLLEKRNANVKFAIHPVAGRMPGHMNVLLAEAGVSYEKIFDMEEINPSFSTADVAVVIGANDVVNPAARLESSSPIYGMPILEAGLAKQVIVIKRGQGKGFSGVENRLFTQDNVHMLYGSGAEVVQGLINEVKNV